jgi:hypothetical protein
LSWDNGPNLSVKLKRIRAWIEYNLKVPANIRQLGLAWYHVFQSVLRACLRALPHFLISVVCDARMRTSLRLAHHRFDSSIYSLV